VKGLTSAGAFRIPAALAPVQSMASDGRRLYIADYEGHIGILDRNGHLTRRWSVASSATSTFERSRFVSIAAAPGQVAVVHINLGQVDRYTPSGRLIDVLDGPLFSYADRVAYTPRGALLVRTSEDVVRVDPDGTSRSIARTPSGLPLAARGEHGFWIGSDAGIASFRGDEPVALAGSFDTQPYRNRDGDLQVVGGLTSGNHDDAWTVDSALIHHIDPEGRVTLGCHVPRASGEVARLGDELLVRTNNNFARLKISRQHRGFCRASALTLSSARLVRPNGAARPTAVSIRLNRRASVRVQLFRVDHGPCALSAEQPSQSCGILQPVEQSKVLHLGRHASFRLARLHAWRELIAGEVYKVRVYATTHRPFARADRRLLRFVA
jgi:hypothetical protein